jgi:hypothetical protein
LPHHRQIPEDFRKKYWDYYRELLVYKEKPGADEAERLSQKFDKLFSQQTGYTLLDLRISATMSNKKSLLMVLDHPDLPLHNNDSELSARTRVRKRDVSFGPRSREGTHAWDLYMSLLVTARKLGINFHEYLRDRISGSFNMPSLAELIRQRGSPQTNSLLETPLLAAA